MKLDRNLNPDGRGKYAVVNLRVLADFEKAKNFVPTADVEALAAAGVVDFGDTDETEFFLIRLKDKYAAAALGAYAMAAFSDDPEFATEILELAKKAANHPLQQKPT